ncbi:P-loop containing nucleoside triphosphate hydrolase protein [Meredithblackwellia eburnea MCA 4105]
MHTFSWSDVSYNAPKNNKTLLSDNNGTVSSGEMLAILGPSGAGKSTLLDLLAGRRSPTSGSITFDGSQDFNIQKLSFFVEQEDALIGVLTVRETVMFAAKLGLPSSISASERDEIVDSTLKTLGLGEVAGNKIGTPISRGISGGQKRRVTLACALVSRPTILLLDEPTSGLDSFTAAEVISSLRTFAQKANIIVIATIHQPSWEAFSCFDNALFLSKGSVVYFGSTQSIPTFFQDAGYPVPEHANPADWAMSCINTDFNSTEAEKTTNEARFHAIQTAFHSHAPLLATPRTERHESDYSSKSGDPELGSIPSARTSSNPIYVTLVLLHRSFLNYIRNLLAYGIRLGMYMGMAIMIATIWIRLPAIDSRINDRLGVHFYSVAFLGFMSVAGIPSYLEERSVFVRERHNGLYGPLPFVLSNTIATAPFLFVCSLAFALISYWAIGLHGGASHFWKFVLYLFLGVYIAESQSILVASLFPIFVAALAISSFMNGFWMSVQGYFIRASSLPKFWRVWAHWIDYQTYSFALLIQNDLVGLSFPCSTSSTGTCQCSFASSLIAKGQCAVAGIDVVRDIGFGGTKTGEYIGILIAVLVVYRMLLLGLLYVKKN